MKKSYIKPEIIFENFSLSTDIAGGCEAITNTHRDGDCGYMFDPTTMIFIEGVSGCEIQISKDDTYDGICYHNPSEFNNLFNS